MKATALPILAIFLCASLAAPLGAKHPLPGPHYLTCEARGNAVLASWDHLGIGPDLDAKLYRDGVFLASLAPESMSFRDEGVPIGPHA